MTRHKTFRNSFYHKSVVVGKRTIKDGECAAVWTLSGRRKLYVGPQRKWIFKSTVQFLDHFVASQNQYMAVQFRDGRKHHVRGPTSCFLDPTKHVSIKVCEALNVDSFEVIVVYREGSSQIVPDEVGMAAQRGLKKLDQTPTAVSAKAGRNIDIHRRIIRGPTLFIPDANEWTHTFKWTMHDKRAPHGQDDWVRRANKFVKLRVLADNFRCRVHDVRTNDDSVIAVNLVVFFELLDVEQMLDRTNDPIGDMVDALGADVTTFGSENSYESFLSKTQRLNSLETFSALCSCAESIGFKVNKVVWRGYTADKSMNELHQKTNTNRRNMKIQAETLTQEQKLADTEFEHRANRTQKERELHMADARHQAEVQLIETESKLEVQRKVHAEKVRQAAEDNQLQSQHLAELSKLGVDLTKFLCVRNARPVDKTIRIEQEAVGPNSSGATTSPVAVHINH